MWLCGRSLNMTDYLQPINPGDDESTQVSKALLGMFAINDNIK